MYDPASALTGTEAVFAAHPVNAAVLALKSRIRLVTKLDSGDLSIDSITSVWPAANFYEREIFDLFGVHFGGHPRLTRIMMPEDWQGHPLRKDYPVEGYR